MGKEITRRDIFKLMSAGVGAAIVGAGAGAVLNSLDSSETGYKDPSSKYVVKNTDSEDIRSEIDRMKYDSEKNNRMGYFPILNDSGDGVRTEKGVYKIKKGGEKVSTSTICISGSEDNRMLDIDNFKYLIDRKGVPADYTIGSISIQDITDHTGPYIMTVKHPYLNDLEKGMHTLKATADIDGIPNSTREIKIEIE